MYILKQLFFSISVNSGRLFTSPLRGSVNILPLFWISQKPNLIIVLLYIERTQKFGSHVSTSSVTARNTNRAKLT